MIVIMREERGYEHQCLIGLMVNVFVNEMKMNHYSSLITYILIIQFREFLDDLSQSTKQ